MLSKMQVYFDIDTSELTNFAGKGSQFVLNLREVGEEGVNNISRKLRKSIKLRAPRGGTDKLADSVRLSDPVKTEDSYQVSVIIDAKSSEGEPYGLYQELGFKPHLVSRKHMQPWLSKHGYSLTGPAIWVSQSRRAPFVKPAFDAIRTYVHQVASGMTLKAARKSQLGR